MTEERRHRLFVAVDVEEPAHAALLHAVRPLEAAHPGLRWNDPATWHVPLAFLGSVPESAGALVSEAAAEVARACAPLQLRLIGRAGVFPGGVLFAEVEDGEELAGLATALAGRLAAVGLPWEDRRQVPHCTLARVPRGSRVPGQLLGEYDGPAVTWTVRRLQVVRSRLRIGGVAHEVRSVHRLMGSR